MYFRTVCTLIPLLFLIESTLSQYTKDGDIIIGGLIPTSDDCEANSKVDQTGIAVMEGINFALGEIETSSDFTNLNKKIGYDIRDTCNDAAKMKNLAYAFSVQKSQKQITKDASIKEALIMMAPFEKDSLKALKILNIENIPQISYSPKNARLIQDDSVPDEEIALLFSSFPDQTLKLKAVYELIAHYKFAHVYVVGSNDAYGKSGVNALTASLAKGGICSADALFVDDADSVSNAVGTIKKNSNIKVVALHTSGHDEAIFKAAKEHNMTDYIFISTNDWLKQMATLKKYSEVVDGMIFVNSEPQASSSYGTHLKELKYPYKNKKWLEKLFVELGGDKKTCYKQTLSTAEKKKCKKINENMKDVLTKEQDMVNFAMDAVYAVAWAILEQGNKTFVDSFKKTSVRNQVTGNKIKFDGGMAVVAEEFQMQNVRKGAKKISLKFVGSWKKDDSRVFDLYTSDVKWKEGDKTTPISQCNDDCPLGTYRVFDDPAKQCCWTCKKCSEGLVSNVTNAAACFACPFEFTGNPDQNACVKYKIIHFHWFDAMGQFMIFLMVFGVCVAMFSLGILSQNSEHAVVKAAGYKCMCVFILGAVLCFLSPIPLLVTPTVKTCSSYIGLFNVALTIPLAVLISKTAIITENYFDEEGDCIKPTLGPRPRAVVILIVVGIQLIIVIVGAFMDPPLTLHNATDQWDQKFAECSCYLNFTFWIAFGYNIAISIIAQFLSCGSTKCDDNFGELRSIICTLLWFYLAVLMEISLIYRETNKRLAEAMAVMCVIFGFFYLLAFAVPKVYTILFKTKPDGTVIEDDPRRSLLLEEKDHVHPTAIHAADGFKHHGIIQMRINEESDEN